MQTDNDFLLEMLEKLPSEADYIDNKIISYVQKGEPFTNEKKCELLKDIVAMANSKNVPYDYRAIIIGITNDGERIGIDENSWVDDATFPTAF